MKIKRFFTALSAACIAIIICSCDNKEVNVEDMAKRSLKVSDFAQYGKLHNALLDNAYSNFSGIDKENLTVEKFVDSICSFNLRYVQANIPDNSYSDILPQQMEKYKNFILADKFLEKAMGHTETRSEAVQYDDINLDSIFSKDVVSLEDIPNLNILVRKMYDMDYLSKDAYLLLTDLLSVVRKSYLGLASDSEYRNDLGKIITSYDKLEYAANDKEGNNVGVVLAVTKASSEWWEQNPQAIDNTTKALPAYLASDAGGAIVSGLSNAFIQRHTSKNFNGKSFLLGVAAGAATSSMGAVNKLVSFGRDLLKLFDL